MKLVRANQKTLAKAAVNHHTDDIQCCAAVSTTPTTRIATSAVHVGLNAAAVTRTHIGHPGPDGKDLNTQFMPRNSWVTKKREFSEVTAEIRAADTHPVRFDKYLPRAWRRRFFNVHVSKLFGLFESNRFHGRSFSENQ